MPTKTFPAPAPFNDEADYLDIALQPVNSSQVAAIGYDPATQTLAVTFTRGSNVYHYPGVSPAVHAAFIGAESIGKYFGQHIKPLPFKKFPARQAA